jgi:hypothetical protein
MTDQPRLRHLAALVDQVLHLSTPDKLRFAAALLVQRNDVALAIAIVRRALDELHLMQTLGQPKE